MERSQVQIIWGTPILDDGFANVPNMLIRNYRKLGITHGEFGLIMQLISYKHDEGNPFPSQETLADNLESSTRAVRKLIASLEDKGLVWVEYQYIEGKRASNIYILKPLIDKCLELFGESRLPDEKPKRRSFRKIRKNDEKLSEPKVPVVQEPEVPVVEEPKVPVGSEPEVPTNITREYNNKNITKEYNNPSITESAIQELSVPISIQKQLILNIDRLIDDDIHLYDIELMYNAYKDNLNEFEFSLILGNVLESTKGQIKSFKHVMMKSIDNHLEKPEKAESKSHKGNEIVPDWFKNRNKETSYKTDYSQYDFTNNNDLLEKEELERIINEYREGTK